MRRRFFVVVGLALAGVVFAAPVPKSKDIDPGKTWEFPNLESKGWEKKDSGLKVWDLKEGEGTEVKAGDAVKVKYIGWLTDGKKFDGNPDLAMTLSLNTVIKGWQEGMVGMKPGGVRRLAVPSELAYGKRGLPGAIPAEATLVFVIEYQGPGDK